MFRYTFLIFMLFFSNYAGAQYLESDLLAWLEKNGRDELNRRLDFINRKYPNSPVPLFLEAFIEENGERAIEIYQRIIREYPQSQFADRSLLKVAQYYYALGSYISARQYLDNLVDQFPESLLIPEAKYLAARCFIALSYYSSAEDELKQVIKKYSDSPFKAQAKRDLTLLKELSSQDRDSPQIGDEKMNPVSQRENLSLSSKYAIQIGAFREKDNALKLKTIYSDRGYLTTLESKYLDGDLLYLVHVGEFETEEQAARFGEVFKTVHGVSFHVVRK